MTQPGMTQPDLAQLTAGVRAVIPIMGAMELSVVDARRGHAAAQLPPGPNVNHFGVMYAGSLFTVAEMLGGVLGLNTFDLEGFVPIVKRMEIRFLKPATGTVTARTSLGEDEIASIEATAREAGKAEFILTTEVVDEVGVVVAATEGLYQMRRF
jgi:thioesterase domain-containing protein